MVFLRPLKPQKPGVHVDTWWDGLKEWAKQHPSAEVNDESRRLDSHEETSKSNHCVESLLGDFDQNNSFLILNFTEIMRKKSLIWDNLRYLTWITWKALKRHISAGKFGSISSSKKNNRNRFWSTATVLHKQFCFPQQKHHCSVIFSWLTCFPAEYLMWQEAGDQWCLQCLMVA